MTTDIIKADMGDMVALIKDGNTGLEAAKGVVARYPEITDTEIDAKAKQLIDKLRLSANMREEKRKPFTRKLDEIKKQFTEIENGFKSLISDMEAKRDRFAQKIVAQKRIKEAEAQEKLRLEREAIDNARRIEAQMEQAYATMLDSVRVYAGTIVATTKNSVASLNESKEKLSVAPQWADKHTAAVMRDIEETSQTTAKLKDFITRFPQDATAILQESLEVLPLAIKNKAEAEKLLAEQQKLAEEVAKKNAEEADAKAEAEKALAALDNMAVIDQSTPKVKETLEIKIKQNPGWLQLIAFWFEKDQDSKTKDLSKKTFAQCKAFCERHANTTGEIIESEYLNYVPKIRAK